MNVDVKHDGSEKKFYCVINGMECLMEYDLLDGGLMSVTHTYVPPELRNQGIAEAILTRAAEYAVTNKMRIDPLCSYAASFFNRHKKYRKLVKDQ